MKDKPQITVVRSKNQSMYHTIGTMIITDSTGLLLFNSYTLERGGGGNEKEFHRVLEGDYPLVYEYSNRFEKNLWELKDTGERSEMKLHSANYWEQLNGCTALGKKLADINEDGYLDVTSSVYTMNRFHQVLRPYEKEVLSIRYIDTQD